MGAGSGLNRVNPNGQFCDELEESVFALKAAEQEIQLAAQVLQSMLRKNGYRHLRPSPREESA